MPARASVMIPNAARSSTEPPGFMNSALPRLSRGCIRRDLNPQPPDPKSASGLFPSLAPIGDHCKTLVATGDFAFLPWLRLAAICPENASQYPKAVSNFFVPGQRRNVAHFGHDAVKASPIQVFGANGNAITFGCGYARSTANLVITNLALVRRHRFTLIVHRLARAEYSEPWPSKTRTFHGWRVAPGARAP